MFKRKAYSVQVRETQGYVPSEIEKRMIQERDITNGVIERISKNLSNIGVTETTETSYRPDSTKTFSLLHFFYLVKQCQQAPTHMLSSFYPGLQTAALVQLSDTLMDLSLKAAQERDIETRREYHHRVNTIMDKMTRGVNQSVEEGSTTTYFHIRQLLDALSNPEFPLLLQEEWTPFIPPLNVNTGSSHCVFRMPQPTVPFPASLLAAYENGMINKQHDDDKGLDNKDGNKKKKKKRQIKKSR
ncbi:hypothetical protein K501DRAFT_286471 [Backusella circina FSU 941]|nr:hypothetical protein K501DRAFT_286471 [Backusella circina FSU 941]